MGTQKSARLSVASAAVLLAWSAGPAFAQTAASLRQTDLEASRTLRDPEVIAIDFARAGHSIQGRHVERIEAFYNVANVFDTNAVTGTQDATVPSGRIAFVPTLSGRIISVSVR